MIKTKLNAKPALLAFVLLLCGGFSMAACGSDDDDEVADCSACAESLRSTCNDAAKACADEGNSTADCQTVIDDVICALGGGDGGL